MSVRSGAMPIERSYLHRAWVAFLLVAAAVALTLAITATPAERIGDLRAPTSQVQQAPRVPPIPIQVGNVSCAQCR